MLARLLVVEVWVELDVQVDEDVEDVAVVEVVSLRERGWRGKDCEGFSFWPILVLFCSDVFLWGRRCLVVGELRIEFESG